MSGPTPAAARKSMLCMLWFVLLWTVVEIIAAPLFSHVSGFVVVWVRYGVHLALMLAIWGWRDPGVLWRTTRPGLQIARSLLMLGMPASWILATERGVTAGELMPLFWLSPLLVLVLAPILLRERVEARYWMAAVAAYVGACLIFDAELPKMLSSIVFPLGMGGTFGLYIVMTRMLRHEPLQANLFYTALGVFVPLSAFIPSVWTPLSTTDFARLIAVGVLGFGALLALDRSVGAAPLSYSAPFVYVQALLTLVLSAILTYGHPSTPALVGGVIIGCVGLYLWWGQAERRAVEQQEVG
jgi:drug/metabolite transporter (DMT)-like permease